jgi:MFS family permease
MAPAGQAGKAQGRPPYAAPATSGNIAAMEQKQRNRVLLVLFGGVLMGALDIAIVGPAMPAIRNEFSVGTRELAWIFNIYVLLNLIGTPLMAKLSDRFGRRIVYVADVALFGIGSLIVASTGPMRNAMPNTAPMSPSALPRFSTGKVSPITAAATGNMPPAPKA